MTNGTKNQQRSKNKMYGWLRRQLSVRRSEWMRGRKHSDESRAKMSAAKLGRKREGHTEETKAKMSAASKGRPKSSAHRAAMSAQRRGIKRGPHSLDTRLKISESNKRVSDQVDRSYMKSDDYRTLQSERTQRVWERRRNGELPPRALHTARAVN